MGRLDGLGSLHRCDNVHIEGLCVYTNAPIAGAFRGYGAPQAYFALETQMDEIAEALGIDPIELRQERHPSRRHRPDGHAVPEQSAARLPATGAPR